MTGPKMIWDTKHSLGDALGVVCEMTVQMNRYDSV